MKSSLKIVIALSLTIIFWASAFVAIRVALTSYPPAHLAVLRYLIASFLLFLVAIFKPIKKPELKDYPGIFLTGFLGITVYHLALNYGELYITASSASFIINAVPILTALLAIIFLNEKLKKYGWVGMTISFIGVTLIILGEGEEFKFNNGGLLVLLASVSQGAFFVLQKPYLKKYHPLDFSTYIIWAGTLFLLILIPGLGNTIQTASLLDTLSVMYLGVFPAVVAYVLFAYVLSKSSAVKSTSFLFLIPVVTIIISWVWLNEFPTFISLIGGLIATLGVVFFYKYAH